MKEDINYLLKDCKKNLTREKIMTIQKLITKKYYECINIPIVNIEKNIKTFKDLYFFLKNYNGTSIIPWLENKWSGKDKQESLLRLFGHLNLINKLQEYHTCIGNFNMKTIQKIRTKEDIFFENNKLRNLKEKGDISDFTCISKKNEKHLLLTTSKNLNSYKIGEMDIGDIETIFNHNYNGYTKNLCICIKNTEDFLKVVERTEKTNKIFKKIILCEGNVFIDWNDLDQAFKTFKVNFSNIKLNNLLKTSFNTLTFKMHQEFAASKIINIKNYSSNKKILLGHIQRSGKSYTIAKSIIIDSSNKKECNYLVITTAPKETLEQQMNVFKCVQLLEFNVIILNGSNKSPCLKTKNIILCSKQFLQTKLDKKNKITSIEWLKNMNFDMRFIDESHYGGTTELAQQTLNFYGKNAFTVFITSTYLKPICDYNIEQCNWLLWDLEDIKLCSKLNSESKIKDECLNRLIMKHGYDILDTINNYTFDELAMEYSKYPTLSIITENLKKEVLNSILEETKDNNYGWSIETCFLLRQKMNEENNKVEFIEEFQNETETLKLWYRIFGCYNKRGISKNNYISIMKRIENACRSSVVKSRFIGYDNFENEPMIIMAFLPQNNIDKVSKATISLLKNKNVIPDFNILNINSKTTSDPKKTIEEHRIKTKNDGKKGLLVLSGKQCSLGVSIHGCDIVLLLNNVNSFDMLQQMMFRSMTEAENKNYGFVVDLNIHRVVENVLKYSHLLDNEEHPQKVVQRLLTERILTINPDEWVENNKEKSLSLLSDNIYKIYSLNIPKALQFHSDIFNDNFNIEVDKRDEKSIEEMFKNVKSIKLFKKVGGISENYNEENKKQIKKGIEKENITNENYENCDNCDSKENKEKTLVYKEIIKQIIPLLCLLSIYNDNLDFIFIFDSLLNNHKLKNVLMEQLKIWWNIPLEEENLLNIYNFSKKYCKNNKAVNNYVRNVKELLLKNKRNSKKLGEIIDDYLKPCDNEKRNNAEISTPMKLREKMLDKIPLDFWSNPDNKIFEPCSGKGGFLLSIVDRFMKGLERIIPNVDERYKTIVEKCIYFSDINPTNIFICNLLLNPDNNFTLNYNENNTLELDIYEKWGLEGFDAVISNPPYNDSSGNKGKGHALWEKFVTYSFDYWLNKNGYLLYVHPSSWRQIDNEILDIFRKKQLLYLEIHNSSDGLKMFKCSTRYDWYLLHNRKKYTTCIVKGEDGVDVEIDLKNWKFIPNMLFNEIECLINNDKKDSLNVNNYRSNYGADKAHVSGIKDKKYKYPVVFSINKNNELSLKYSNCNDRGMFGEPKFIFSNGSGFYCDPKGEYGLTQWAYCIYDDVKNLDKIKTAFCCEKFKKIIAAIKLDSSSYNIKVMKLFKKDFWKNFI